MPLLKLVLLKLLTSKLLLEGATLYLTRLLYLSGKVSQ